MPEQGGTMIRRNLGRGALLAAVPMLMMPPALAAAVHTEYNIGGIGYVYGDEYARNILGSSEYRVPDSQQVFLNQESQYPNTGTDAGNQLGVTSLLALMHLTCDGQPDCTIAVFAASDGSVVGSRTNDAMIASNDPLLKKTTFYLQVNPVDPNGGIGTRLPVGMTIPFTGVTAGNPTVDTGARVYSIKMQYDVISDAPANANPVAWANAVLGFFYVHPLVDPNMDDPNNITVTSPNGQLTSTLVYTHQLPLTQPLVGIVPQPIINAFDPFLRSVIETGYQRPNPADPSNPANNPANVIPLSIAPPVGNWIPDVVSIAAGAVQTGIKLLQAPGEILGGTAQVATVAPATVAPATTAKLAAVESQPDPPKKPVVKTVDMTQGNKAEPGTVSTQATGGGGNTEATTTTPSLASEQQSEPAASEPASDNTASDSSTPAG